MRASRVHPGAARSPGHPEKDRFFVLGDNSASSKDSRLWEPERIDYWVTRKLLIGKALLHLLAALLGLAAVMGQSAVFPEFPRLPNFGRMRLRAIIGNCRHFRQSDGTSRRPQGRTVRCWKSKDW